MSAPAVVGILLAAGRGTRFGGAKLLARLTEGERAGEQVGVAALRNLAAAMSEVLAVVRPDDSVLADALAAAGARIVRCPKADEGMGASLACGVRASAEAGGWVVALADMPSIRPATIAQVAAAIAGGASLAAPYRDGERGPPVGFGREHYAALAALGGDVGARELVAAHAQRIVRVAVDDPGIHHDVDTPADL